MVEQFKNLSETEIALLQDAVPMITVLIAGADGTIDAKEESWAKKVANIRTYNNPEVLTDYYKLVGETYEVEVHKHMSLEGDTASKTTFLSDKIAGLNEILAKLEPKFAKEMVDSFKSFANHVARASGGILGYGSISNEEKALVELPMLNDIIIPEKEEE